MREPKLLRRICPDDGAGAGKPRRGGQWSLRNRKDRDRLRKLPSSVNVLVTPNAVENMGEALVDNVALVV